jgi:hypothetical protein
MIPHNPMRADPRFSAGVRGWFAPLSPNGGAVVVVRPRYTIWSSA